MAELGQLSWGCGLGGTDIEEGDCYVEQQQGPGLCRLWPPGNMIGRVLPACQVGQWDSRTSFLKDEGWRVRYRRMGDEMQELRL